MTRGVYIRGLSTTPPIGKYHPITRKSAFGTQKPVRVSHNIRKAMLFWPLQIFSVSLIDSLKLYPILKEAMVNTFHWEICPSSVSIEHGLAVVGRAELVRKEGRS